MGLGIACLTLALSGVTRASTIQVDCGKYGKNDKKIECKDDHKNKEVCFEIKKDVKDIKEDLKDYTCDLKDLKSDIKHDKDGRLCKDIKHDEKDIREDRKDIKCDVKELKELLKHCHVYNLCEVGLGGKDLRLINQIDGCGHNQGGNSWEHACAVPTPAASAMSGAGLLGIMLMGLVRSRRSIA
jgi:hypothetical protein